MSIEGVVPWPSELADGYRAAGCWQGRTFGSYLWQWAQSRGEKVAVIDGQVRLTYRDLATSVDALAAALTDFGLSRGETAMVQLPNSWELIVVTLACMRLGVAPVMMLPAHRDYEMTSIAEHVRARAIIVPDRWRDYDHQDLANRVAGALPWPTTTFVVGDHIGSDAVDVRGLLRRGEHDGQASRLDGLAPQASDVAVFLLSGGTTGVPKVIARTHDDYLYQVRRAVDVCGFDADTVYLAALPASHNFALASPGVLGALFAGGTAVLVSSPRPAAAFAAITAHGVTVTSAVPAVALAWAEGAAERRPDLSSLRYIHIGGSVLAPEVAARISVSLNCRVQQVYGMAEGLICYTALDAPDDVALHTQGAPISPYDELRVVDGTGAPVPAGEIGELLTRGPYTPCGYFAAPEQNRLSYTVDGYYRTGDLVRITAAGNVVVCGRVKDLINRAGEKISAAEVESLVQEMPEVAEVAAVALPDPVVGERVCLVVRASSGCHIDLDMVAATLSARGLAGFKVPERLVVVDELPHTAIGKPDKKALRALLVTGSSSVVDTQSAS